MNLYQTLSEELQEKIRKDFKGSYILENTAIRRDPNHDTPSLWRSCYLRDVEKIMHSPYYNRYTDKTQVFAFYKNDDISRRAFHVQLVSRIARNIGRMLGLNLDLIEAIALGHDIGHTPFGHAGEHFLNELSLEYTGRQFHHNVHSVRVLDGIFRHNISLQTLDGILCHNGEMEQKEYRTAPLFDFSEFDEKVESCYVTEGAVKKLTPSTKEGCVVKICDLIAYLGKDRQDALKTETLSSEELFSETSLGKHNAMIINNLCVNIIEKSYGKDCIAMDEESFLALSKIKEENYRLIYGSKRVKEIEVLLKPMFRELYEKLREDLANNRTTSPIFHHHLDFVAEHGKYYRQNNYQEETTIDQMVIDYMASMTDDYFIELYEHLFPDKKSPLVYTPYFN
ncbi:MAG: HD domain-containing protein [Ruminococcaceae bacterium]|nr:HD domain-containing protein [Oscillospiraceae bacterium]